MSKETTEPVPHLEPSDRLTREEFERRSNAMPGLKKAELIDEVVYMPSPVRHGRHSRAHLILGTWLGLDGVLDWFVLADERYERSRPGADGLFRSAVFPGLWIDPTALLKGDVPRNLAVLQQRVASAEHAAVVRRLHEASS